MNIYNYAGQEFTEDQISYAADDIKVLPIIFSKQMKVCNTKNM